MQWADGAFYSGYFSNNMMEGKGYKTTKNNMKDNTLGLREYRHSLESGEGTRWKEREFYHFRMVAGTKDYTLMIRSTVKEPSNGV